MTLTDSTMRAASPALDDDAIEAFRQRLHGVLLVPGDDGYDAARQVWNAMIDRRPALIARCAGVADVVAAVNFARDHDLLVAVRGGGHNITGAAVCDGGLMIDLSSMKGIRVDPDARTVRAEGGVTWGELDHETQAFGLATTGGAVSTTGIGGLSLGGGFGWLARKHGVVCDNLLAADVVTADGRLLHASADEHPDLFWGLRGGGGNFGIVVAFEFQLHPVGPIVLAGPIFHPIDAAPDLFRAFRDVAAAAPDELGGMVALLTSPEGAPLSAVVPIFVGPLDEGEAVVRPLRAVGEPAADMLGPMPYQVVQTLFDGAFPAGRRNYWKSGYMRKLDDAAIAIMTDHFSRAPSPHAGIDLELYGGATNRPAPGETAFPHRDYQFNLLIFTAWDDPADDQANIAWARQFWQALRPFLADGVFVNYLGDAADGAPNQIRAAYGPDYERLVALKHAYDPTNLFRMNQNIAPA